MWLINASATNRVEGNRSSLVALCLPTIHSARRTRIISPSLPPQTQNPELARDYYWRRVPSARNFAVAFGKLQEHPRTFGTLSDTTLNNVMLSLYVRTGYDSLEVRPTDFRAVAPPWL